MSRYSSQPLKPARHIIPFTKKERALWDEEEKSIDLNIYNQSLLKTIKEFDRKTAEEEKRKKDMEWYQEMKDEARAQLHTDNDLRLFQKPPHNRPIIKYT